jgi:hypothetical protein
MALADCPLASRREVIGRAGSVTPRKEADTTIGV